MAVNNCTPDALATASQCYTCLTPGELEAIQTYLLAKIAGVTDTPQELVNKATCFAQCIPPGMQKTVQNYLLCVIANK